MFNIKTATTVAPTKTKKTETVRSAYQMKYTRNGDKFQFKFGTKQFESMSLDTQGLIYLVDDKNNIAVSTVAYEQATMFKKPKGDVKSHIISGNIISKKETFSKRFWNDTVKAGLISDKDTEINLSFTKLNETYKGNPIWEVSKLSIEPSEIKFEPVTEQVTENIVETVEDEF